MDMLADLELLLYLATFLNVDDDLPLICQSVVDRDYPLNEGYELLIRSIAGCD